MSYHYLAGKKTPLSGSFGNSNTERFWRAGGGGRGAETFQISQGQTRIKSERASARVGTRPCQPLPPQATPLTKRHLAELRHRSCITNGRVVDRHARPPSPVHQRRCRTRRVALFCMKRTMNGLAPHGMRVGRTQWHALSAASKQQSCRKAGNGTVHAENF